MMILLFIIPLAFLLLSLSFHLRVVDPEEIQAKVLEQVQERMREERAQLRNELAEEVKVASNLLTIDARTSVIWVFLILGS